MTQNWPWTFSKDDPAGADLEDRIQDVLDAIGQQFPVGNANLSNRVVYGGNSATWVAAVASGVVTITHGLGSAPTAVVVTFSTIGSGVHAWGEVGNVGATTFQVQGVSPAAITATLGFYWVAYS